MITYHVGDTREVIATIPDGSVDLVATSPPFYQLRSYVPTDHDAKSFEIGSEPDPATFLDTLLELTAEWGRVLAPHGSIAVELGDTYMGSGGGGGDYLPGGMRDGQPAFGGSARASNAAHWRAKNARTGSLKANPKSLACIPDLYTIALAYGIHPLTGKESPAGKWLVRNKIVWHRPNPAVGALGDKVRPSTSYIVIATRSAKRWFDLTAVRHEHTEPGATRAQSKHGIMSPWREGKLIDQNPAGAPPLDAWFDEYDGSHDTWTLTTQPSRLAHYAMWPAKLAERLILSMCPHEVCRECGEPRRRVETQTPMLDGIPLLKAVDASARDREGGAAHGFDHNRLSTAISTLGWTECGCVCPTCNGKQRITFEVDCDFHDPEARCNNCRTCPDCVDGRPYRPGLVLDPFAGSGTTLAVADLHGRDAIGIDFDARNKAIYPARYDEVKKALFGTPAPMPGQETFDFAI